MSHTTRLGANWIAIHNGDFSGEVSLRKLDGNGLVEQEVVAPFGIFVNLVAAHVLSERIDALEQMSSCEILGIDPSYEVE
jgi:hypothetical protein